MVKVEEYNNSSPNQKSRMSSSRSNENDITTTSSSNNKKPKESVFSKLFGSKRSTSKNLNTSNNNQNQPASIITKSSSNDNNNNINNRNINTNNNNNNNNNNNQSQKDLQPSKIITNINNNNNNNNKETPVSKNKLRCRVSLLDDTVKVFDIDKLASGQDLFEIVCTYLELIEKEYFSLTFRDSNSMKFWLDHEKKVKSQLKGVISDIEPSFNFEVKFYPPEPQLLQEDITRYLLTLQLRHDIMDGKLPCSFVTHALLGSYIAQSELGDFDPQIHGRDYLKDIFLAPNQTPSLLEAVAEYHKDHHGQSPAEAEMHYLENAVKLAMYGVDLHNAKDSDDIDILIGISASGLMVYRDHLRINRFAWPKILKISYKRNHFYLKLRAGEFEKYESTIGFRCPNHKSAKRLWKVAVEHHAFFRLREPEKPLKTMMPTFNKRYRYTGSSTYIQSRQRSIERQQPLFERTLSKQLTRSMDRGLATNNNMSTLSIPNRLKSNDTDDEQEEEEYNTKEQPSATLPHLKYLKNNQQGGNSGGYSPTVHAVDASIGAFNNNSNQTTPLVINKKPVQNNLQPRKQLDDDEYYTDSIRNKISDVVPSNYSGGNISTPKLEPDRQFGPNQGPPPQRYVQNLQPKSVTDVLIQQFQPPNLASNRNNQFDASSSKTSPIIPKQFNPNDGGISPIVPKANLNSNNNDFGINDPRTSSQRSDYQDIYNNNNNTRNQVPPIPLERSSNRYSDNQLGNNNITPKNELDDFEFKQRQLQAEYEKQQELRLKNQRELELIKKQQEDREQEELKLKKLKEQQKREQELLKQQELEREKELLRLKNEELKRQQEAELKKQQQEQQELLRRQQEAELKKQQEQELLRLKNEELRRQQQEQELLKQKQQNPVKPDTKILPTNVGSDVNHKDVLLQAIRIATELDPSFEVEKVEITTTED